MWVLWCARSHKCLQGIFVWASCSQPFSGGDLISPLKASENKTACVCIYVCLTQCVCMCLCARVRAQTRPGQPFPISARRFEKRGRKSQSSSYYSSLKANGEEAEEELGERGEGGREGCRKEERESQMGGMKGGVGGYINSYLTIFGILHPGWPRSRIYISICLSVCLGNFRL